MVAIGGSPTEATFPWPDRIKFLDAHARALHPPELLSVGIDRSERVVNDVDLHALLRLFAEQIGERLTCGIVGEDVDFKADAALGVLDRVVRRVQRLAVFVE